jgi:hypothetical protein
VCKLKKEQHQTTVSFYYCDAEVDADADANDGAEETGANDDADDRVFYYARASLQRGVVADALNTAAAAAAATARLQTNSLISATRLHTGLAHQYCQCHSIKQQRLQQRRAALQNAARIATLKQWRDETPGTNDNNNNNNNNYGTASPTPSSAGKFARRAHALLAVTSIARRFAKGFALGWAIPGVLQLLSGVLKSRGQPRRLQRAVVTTLTSTSNMRSGALVGSFIALFQATLRLLRKDRGIVGRCVARCMRMLILLRKMFLLRKTRSQQISRSILFSFFVLLSIYSECAAIAGGVAGLSLLIVPKADRYSCR